MERYLVCVHTNEKSALALAEKLRLRIHMYKFNSIGNITASFGISEYNENKKSLNELLTNANKALNDAKRSGKNQCSIC